MRLRIPELLQEHGLTPYGLSVRSKGRLSLSTAYRLARVKGRVKSFDARLLDVICDTLKIEPSDLLERDRDARNSSATPRKRSRGRTS